MKAIDSSVTKRIRATPSQAKPIIIINESPCLQQGEMKQETGTIAMLQCPVYRALEKISYPMIQVDAQSTSHSAVLKSGH